MISVKNITDRTVSFSYPVIRDGKLKRSVRWIKIKAGEIKEIPDELGWRAAGQRDENKQPKLEIIKKPAKKEEEMEDVPEVKEELKKKRVTSSRR